MKITERRIVIQEWYETDLNKNGWDSHGWIFKDDRTSIHSTGFEVINVLDSDKYYNPLLGIAEKETEI